MDALEGGCARTQQCAAAQLAEAALEWACVHVPRERLPARLAAAVQAECLGAVRRLDTASKSTTATASSSSSQQQQQPQAGNAKANLQDKAKQGRAKVATASKAEVSWIMQYCMQSQEEEESGEEEDKKKGKDVAEMSFEELKADMEAEKAKPGRARDVLRIRELAARIKMLSVQEPPPAKHETEPETSAPESEQQKQLEADGIPSMFDELAPAEGVGESTTADEFAPPEPLIPPSWTGKTPVVLLQDWCRKHGRPQPRFAPQPQTASGLHSCHAEIVDKRRAKVTVTLDTRYRTAASAKNAVSTKALYLLAAPDPLYRLLPAGHFLDLWTMLESESRQKVTDNRREAASQRAELVRTALNRISRALLSGDGTPAAEIATQAAAETTRTSDPALECPVTGLRRQIEPQDEALQRAWERRQKDPSYLALLEQRRRLPVSDMRAQLLQLFAEHQVVVVSGHTGSGKSTQIPQFILDDADSSHRGSQCYILCSQPRRISATSLAARVAEERGERLENRSCAVGYQVRLLSTLGPSTRLVFCTTGVLIRRLHSSKYLDGVSHVIVDEVHERSLETDFLLCVLKDLVSRRKDLRVVLMSATFNATFFSAYFGGCPAVSVPGSLFDVHTLFLEDALEQTIHSVTATSPYARQSGRHCVHSGTLYMTDERGRKQKRQWEDWERDDSDVPPTLTCGPEYSVTTMESLSHMNELVVDVDLVEELVWLIHEQNPLSSGRDVAGGSVLIFVPGLAEINAVIDKLIESCGPTRHGYCPFDFVPLHSLVPMEEQQRVFAPPAPGRRKVVVATNIAETSITVVDVGFVIDSGLAKEYRFDPKRQMSKLVTSLQSRANCRQRSGRAGRVGPGVAYRLYTRYRFEEAMREFPEPEMKRLPLEELCLQVKLLNLDRSAAAFLSRAPDPPHPSSVRAALDNLASVGALVETPATLDDSEGDPDDSGESLTALGRHLAMLPVDVHLGKLLVLGCVFGVVEECLTIAAASSVQSPFVPARIAGSSQAGESESAAAASFAAGTLSDQLAVAHAYEAWEAAARGPGGAAAERGLCARRGLSSQRMREIGELRGHFRHLLEAIGFDTEPPPADSAIAKLVPTERATLVKALICAGLYPRLARIEYPESEAALDRLPRFFGPGGEELHAHPASALHSVPARDYAGRPRWLAFHQKAQAGVGPSARALVRGCTVCGSYALLLFCGRAITVRWEEATCAVDGWSLQAPGQTAALFRVLRRDLDQQLAANFERPGDTLSPGSPLVTLITRLLLQEPVS
eukprot:TRINITY_DN7166_c0_g1_i2.p1 TRINITY_DN7166_c0_g1~~TRINITY_DN7166_c0_g1_i2.p1  ORF type:complete len:1336 (-),score=334.04 TRINITY_DN7166_c0_g1_i2:75-3887(-)